MVNNNALDDVACRFAFFMNEIIEVIIPWRRHLQGLKSSQGWNACSA
jgi:hypothetical protein